MENFRICSDDSFDAMLDDGMQRYLKEVSLRVAVARHGKRSLVIRILLLKLEDCLFQCVDEDGTRQQKLKNKFVKFQTKLDILITHSKSFEWMEIHYSIIHVEATFWLTFLSI